MRKEIGHVCELARYPVKSMAGTVVRLNKNNAGVYGTVVQTGTIRVGDPVSLVLDARL